MEARDGSTGDGDEHHREDGCRLPFLVDQRTVPEFGKAGIGHHKISADADSHEDETEGKDGIDVADDLIDRAKGGNDIVEEDDDNPTVGIEAPTRSHGTEQLGRTADERGSKKDEQHTDEDAHHLARKLAQIGTDDLGEGSTIHTDAHHRGQIVVNCTRKDTAEHNPQVGCRSELGTHDGTEDGTQTCNVEELDHVDLPSGHGDIVDAVLLGVGRRFAILFRMKHSADKAAIGEIADNQRG